MLSVDLQSPEGADRPSKAQVGAGHRRSGSHARIVAEAQARSENARGAKQTFAGTRRTHVSGGDRADVAGRSGDSPCRTAPYATGRDAQTRWLFWWSSRRLNAALVPSNEASAFVPKRAYRLARCTRSDCRGEQQRGGGWRR
jgi:hypothetical protein